MKAICINNQGYPHLLMKGREYEITLVPLRVNAVFVKGVDHPHWASGWDKARFQVIEESKLDLTKPVQTRAGQPIRILCTDASGLGGPVVGLDEKGNISRWSLDGRWRGISPDPFDLVNVPEKPKAATRIIGMQSGGNLVVLKGGTKWADRMKGKTQTPRDHFIAFKEITITEGEGMAEA